MDNHDDTGVDITVVITCYNEEDYIIDSIKNVISALQDAERSFEIIVIDDVSMDGSVRVIEDYVRDNPDHPVKLVANQRNRGLACNFVEGAFLGKGRYYRLCCGDNPEPVDSMSNLYKHIGKADILIPVHRQKDIMGKSLYRRMLSRVFTCFMDLISGYRIGYYNGLAVYRRDLVMRWSPVSYGFGFQVDTLTRILDEESVTYAQVPMWGGIDRKGKSTTALSIRHLLSVIHAVLEIILRRTRMYLYDQKRRGSKAVQLEGSPKDGSL